MPFVYAHKFFNRLFWFVLYLLMSVNYLSEICITMEFQRHDRLSCRLLLPHCYLAGAITAVMLLVIDHAKLSRSYALYHLLGMNDKLSIARPLKHGGMVLWRVAYLEAHTCRRARLAPGVEREEMEIVDGEVLAIGSGRLEALADVEYVGSDVLLHNIPWTAAEAQTVALADSVKPQSLMATYQLARLQLKHVARTLAEIAADVVVVVDFAEEADALRVLALGVYQVFAFGYGTHLVLFVMAYGEYRLLKLP